MKTKAAFFKKTGGPDVLEWGDIELPALQPREVLVKVIAVAVNPIDTYIRSGKFKKEGLPVPFIIGSDMVGTVEKVGGEVNQLKEGQKVWTNSAGMGGKQGCTAEHAILQSDALYPIPEGVDPIQLVALGQTAATACRGMIQAAQLRAGEILFIHGAAGGVGSALIQLAVARGARVIAATSGGDKMAWCKELGAELVLDYKKDNLEEKVRKAVSNGVHVFWDTSRSPNFDLAVKILAPAGRIVLMAGAEARPEFPVGAFYRQEMTMRGFSLLVATKEELRGYADIINRCISEKKLKAKIAKNFPLAKASEAHALLEKDHDLWGKVVLTA